MVESLERGMSLKVLFTCKAKLRRKGALLQQERGLKVIFVYDNWDSICKTPLNGSTSKVISDQSKQYLKIFEYKRNASQAVL